MQILDINYIVIQKPINNCRRYEKKGTVTASETIQKFILIRLKKAVCHSRKPFNSNGWWTIKCPDDKICIAIF